MNLWYYRQLATIVDWARSRIAPCLAVCALVLSGGCFLETEVEPYYGVANPPRAQEFRWSDGGLPRVFDPAFATAPPDTDAVRALFEGLTDYDPKTLGPVPAAAERWESTPDARVWTFYLRQDARWADGQPVTAEDFVRSWKRILNFGDRAPNAKLLANIEGANAPKAKPQSPAPSQVPPVATTENKTVARPGSAGEKQPVAPVIEIQPQLGVEAVTTRVLRVTLQKPDKDFASLVAHPVFRPVNGAANNEALADSPVGNGAFEIGRISDDSVVLQRSPHYWDADDVNLQRVRFVAAESPEAALAAYKSGEIDAVSNAGLEPLAIKLLSPYGDFRRSAYAALTFYDFNVKRVPLSDVRVREALSIAIDRDRISQDGLGGATVPARRFLLQVESAPKQNDASPAKDLVTNVGRARALMAEAGYPKGQGFPKITLLINRNEQQRLVAQTISSMWKNTLGISTEIVSKSWDEYEAALVAGEYDIARRSVVMQTPDERMNIAQLFDLELLKGYQPPTIVVSPSEPHPSPDDAKTMGPKVALDAGSPVLPEALHIASESDAMSQFVGMPIFFASSYALVKPYVLGFETNLLDAPSLKSVKINTEWEPPKKPDAFWKK